MVRALICLVLFAGATTLAGCSSDGGHEVAVDAVRQAASGAKPATCPVGVDLPGALRTAGVARPVQPDATDVEVSETDTPAADAVGAREDGLEAQDSGAA